MLNDTIIHDNFPHVIINKKYKHVYTVLGKSNETCDLIKLGQNKYRKTHIFLYVQETFHGISTNNVFFAILDEKSQFYNHYSSIFKNKKDNKLYVNIFFDSQFNSNSLEYKIIKNVANSIIESYYVPLLGDRLVL